ncbi:hypothetical protein KSS87_001851 [Heliosperma pusillum]|nr:hypothetical protein KSS87_001851 [Heliosperma pusillum]
MKMEGNGLTTRMYTNTNIGRGMVSLQAQNPQHNLPKHPQFMGIPQKQQKYQIDQQQTQLSIKQPIYNNNNNNDNNNPSPSPTQKSNIQLNQFSKNDEDDPDCSHENGSNDLKRKSGSNVSQWHRVKWTDDMVTLLIMAVYYIGDDAGGSELGSEKKKPGCGGGCGSGSGGGALQKKGKWKSVSMAMMEKGFCVSPQQCEDKFNDLNKRYKRVNDILGKGIACNVVENQSLLESMDIAPNLKEEVRKLLNSKHLFFREMCAYHNSCGNNAHSIGGAATTTPPPQHNWDGEDSNNGDDSEDEDDDDDEVVEDHEDMNGRKKARTMGTESLNGLNELNQWSGLVKGMLEDGSKSLWEKKQWVMIQMVKLEENGVKIQCQALELEKERLKWMKFSSKKEREMEKIKIDNEKKRLENERKLLMLRKKEIECLLVEKQ